MTRPFDKNLLLAAFDPASPVGPRKVGLETEKFLLDASSGQAWPVNGSDGVQWIMKELADRFGYTVNSEGDSIIALQRDGHQVSLEPGGQIEFSSLQSEYISDLYQAELRHLKELKEVLAGKNIAISYIACHPISDLPDVEWVSKKRYQLMREFFKNTGDLGEWMMKMTSSVQVSLDYRDESEAGNMLGVISRLTPLFIGMSAFSPFRNRIPSGFLSYRAHIWSRTDAKRCGLPPCFFEKGNVYKNYRDYALKVPMLFELESNGIRKSDGKTFEEWCCSASLSEVEVMKAWKTHLTCLFPEVRMKNYLEVRSFDALPGVNAFGVATLLKNIFYDDTAFSGIQDELCRISREDVVAGCESASRFGMNGYFADRQIYEWVSWLFKVASEGGVSLAEKNATHSGDDRYLSELFRNVVASNRTFAEQLIEICKTIPLNQAITREPFGFSF